MEANILPNSLCSILVSPREVTYTQDLNYEVRQMLDLETRQEVATHLFTICRRGKQRKLVAKVANGQFALNVIFPHILELVNF